MSDILSPAAARDHLRVGEEVSDESLSGLIDTAEAAVSDFLGRPLIGAVNGWADAAAVPANVVHAIKLVVTDLFENRLSPLDDMASVRSLIGRYVIVSIG